MTFHATITVKDVDVEVEVQCQGGHYAPENRRGHPDNWTPDESEDPEITAVYALRADGKRSKDILKRLPDETIGGLVRQAWGHYMEDRDHGPEYEPDRDDYEISDGPD